MIDILWVLCVIFFALHARTLYRSWMDDGKRLFDSQSEYVLEEIQ